VAQEHKVTVAIHVSTQGLDLSQPADAQIFYTRLKKAAWVACTHANRVDLVPSDNPGACAEKALAGAIRSASVPTLSQIYLANHTIQEAVAGGILVPALIAGK
jgi:UrcA family protein